MIAKRQLSWQAGTVKSKVHDGNTDAEIATHPTLTGLVSGDLLSTVATIDHTSAQVEFEGAGVGSHAIIVSGYVVTLLSDENGWKYVLPTMVAGQPPFANRVINPVGGGNVPQTGLADLRLSTWLMIIFGVMSAGLWGCVVLRRREMSLEN